jgi:flavin reductase (DIM6/NTAB) family NADH-FMN oxidoreductase RutF
VFYGKLKTAPMIAECPISMECKLTKVVDFPKHDIFIGEIAEETVLTDGVVDYSKVQPFFFTMTDNGYWKLGERFAQAWSVGKVVEK